jgi:predicted nucleotidyltransferase
MLFMDRSEPLSEADRELIRGIALRVKDENAREEALVARRLQSAKAEALALARRLAADPQVRRVLFFGSAATGRDFRLDSDIDLAVEGGDILFHRATTERSAFSVDVVDIPALPVPLRKAIEMEGEILFEKHE